MVPIRATTYARQSVLGNVQSRHAPTEALAQMALEMSTTASACNGGNIVDGETSLPRYVPKHSLFAGKLYTTVHISLQEVSRFEGSGNKVVQTKGIKGT